MFEHRADDAHVELAELRRQRVNVSVEDFGTRAEQPVAEPVRVLPAFDRDAVVGGPEVGVAVVELFAERNEMLWSRVAHVERKHAARTASLRLKTQEARRRANVENALTFDDDAADVVSEATAQVPVPAHDAEAGQLHRVIEVAVLKPLYHSRLGEQRTAARHFPKVVLFHLTLRSQTRDV